MQQQYQSQSQPQQQQNQKIKLLICNPSPRVIKPFEEKIKEINEFYDIYRVKFNFDEQDAYKQCREFFLNHKEYTHLALLPDDLLIDREDIDLLVNDIEHNDYPVISGICNFSAMNDKFLDIMTAIPYDRYSAYEYFKSEAKYTINDLVTRTYIENKLEKREYIERCLFIGFAFTVIRRDVLEKFGFKPLPQTSTDIEAGMGLDTLFFHNCMRKKIPCYIDYRVESFHLRGIENNRHNTNIIKFHLKNNIKTSIIPFKDNKQENILLKATNNKYNVEPTTNSGTITTTTTDPNGGTDKT